MCLSEGNWYANDSKTDFSMQGSFSGSYHKNSKKHKRTCANPGRFENQAFRSASVLPGNAENFGFALRFPKIHLIQIRFFQPFAPSPLKAFDRVRNFG